jgi:hypothetical protein
MLNRKSKSLFFPLFFGHSSWSTQISLHVGRSNSNGSQERRQLQHGYLTQRGGFLVPLLRMHK